VLNVDKYDLKIRQKNDVSLSRVRELVNYAAKQYSTGRQVSYVESKGILHRIFTDSKGRCAKQLVLPLELRKGVLEVAHDSILGGHLRYKKTLARVLGNFYWPGVGNDVKRYCQSCDRCQKTMDKGKVRVVPLGDMPIIDIPFSRVAVDLIGPLTMSDRGMRYVLTLIDYATRYPEATALKRTETTDVAEALLEMFSRLGFPREILSDNGPQFISAVIKEVMRLMSIKELKSSPYHPMANGLCENFNRTLKAMIRRMSGERPKDWDRYLPSLLFAYREIPQESLQFSPFEMLYGRTVRGPLAILREIWTGDEVDNEVRSTYQYVFELRERLEETCRIAHEELSKAKVKQKGYYNKKAKERKLEIGDKILLLLPTDNNKLTMEWKGPFSIVGKVGENDYRIDIFGKIKIFHANMIKKYYERLEDSKVGTNKVMMCLGCLEMQIVEGNMAVCEVSEDENCEIEFCPLIPKENWKDAVINEDLSHEQYTEMRNLLHEFSDVFSDLPGKTDLVEMHIELEEDKPFCTKPYPTPFALKTKMGEEVTSMEQLSVIEDSLSEYASPPVVVCKSDQTLRYCIDFRRLNSVTRFLAEPVSNQEAILAKLGKAVFLSKIDLSKGYWQIPLCKCCRHYTAFQTDQGLKQFTVMPFGLVNSSAYFCRMMRLLLKDMHEASNYIDDVLLDSVDWNCHLATVRELLVRLRQHNLKARPSKCKFGYSQVDFLGHTVGHGELKSQDEKVQGILNTVRPKTKKQLRSFLGMTGYQSKFIQNYAKIVVPLTDMTKKGHPSTLNWSQEADDAFWLLRDEISKQPVLKLPDFDKPFIVGTDASAVGLGGVLMQEYGSQKFPVLYVSRKLKPAETRYSTIERECLALVWTIKRLRRYLYGREFILEVDHQPLQFLNRAKIDNDRVMHWALELQKYKFVVHVVKGKDHVTADYLSRCEASN